MATRAEDVGVAKVAMDRASVLTLAVLAGAFIALGAVVSTVVLAGPRAPSGVTRLVAGTAFSVGLILVLVGGAELFTGNALIVIAWASGRVRTRGLLHNWVIVYLGNFIGALSVAAMIVVGGAYALGDGAFGVTALGIAAAKLQHGFGQAVVLGILCNVLVCLAVWLTLSARTTADRILAIVPPVSAFVAAGFEHSIANMYFVPAGLLLVAWDPAFVAAHGLQAPAAILSWRGLLVDNLLPVTIGNVLGGAVLVAAVYWSVYLRPRRAVERASPPASGGGTVRRPRGVR